MPHTLAPSHIVQCSLTIWYSLCLCKCVCVCLLVKRTRTNSMRLSNWIKKNLFKDHTQSNHVCLFRTQSDIENLLYRRKRYKHTHTHIAAQIENKTCMQAHSHTVKDSTYDTRKKEEKEKKRKTHRSKPFCVINVFDFSLNTNTDTIAHTFILFYFRFSHSCHSSHTFQLSTISPVMSLFTINLYIHIWYLSFILLTVYWKVAPCGCMFYFLPGGKIMYFIWTSIVLHY